MLSMSSLPNFFLPLLGGLFLDKRGHRFATLVFLFLILLGQAIFTIAMELGSFNWGEGMQGGRPKSTLGARR
jgi:hypothetical protein